MEIARRVGGRIDPQEKRRILAAYEQTALSQREFARQQGISLACLSLWLRKSKSCQPTQARLIPVEDVLQLPGPASGAYQIHFPSGLSLEVAQGLTNAQLIELCRGLRSL